MQKVHGQRKIFAQHFFCLKKLVTEKRFKRLGNYEKLIRLSGIKIILRTFFLAFLNFSFGALLSRLRNKKDRFVISRKVINNTDYTETNL